MVGSVIPDRSWAPATFPEYQPTVPNLLASGVARFPDRECVVTPDDRLTYRQLEERSARLSSYKVPRHVFFLTDDDVSWLVSQKVDRRALADMAQKLVAEA